MDVTLPRNLRFAPSLYWSRSGHACTHHTFCNGDVEKSTAQISWHGAVLGDFRLLGQLGYFLCSEYWNFQKKNLPYSGHLVREYKSIDDLAYNICFEIKSEEAA